jgi:hypothetical protein
MTGAGLIRQADNLPNITPAPKLNRYAESAVPNFQVNETEMLDVLVPRAHETNLKLLEADR